MGEDSEKSRIQDWMRARRGSRQRSVGESALVADKTDAESGEGQAPSSDSARALVATIMMNSLTRTEKLVPGGKASALLEQGLLKQAVAESIRYLRKNPDSLFAIETLLKAQWKTGDIYGALKWVRRALRINPNEPGYYFTRGLLHQSLGMYQDAMNDFECARNVAQTEEMREQSLAALIALEDWQTELVSVLLAEDRAFRFAFRIDPVSATAARGFRFTTDGHRALLLIADDRHASEGKLATPGIA